MARKLLFGLTLILALASMYAGLFGFQTLQYVLIVAVLVSVGLALSAPSGAG